MSTPTAQSTLTTAVDTLDEQLLAVAGTGLAIGVVVFALRRGWRLLKGFAS